MQINCINTKNTSFKQIKLNSIELSKCKNGFNKILTEPSVLNHNYKLFDMLESHLNDEIDLKQLKTNQDRKDFAVNLYLKFFKFLEKNKLELKPFDNFLSEINDFIENYTENNYIDYHNVSNNFNISNVKNLVDSISSYLGLTKEDLINKAFYFPILQYSTENSIPQIMDGMSEKLGFEKEELVGFFNKNQKPFISSISKVVERVQENMKTLKVDNIEAYRYLVRKNPFLLANKNLSNQIKELTEFLEADEDEIVQLVKKHGRLLALNINHIKENFYTMKDYLNVNRKKMQEISVHAPTLLFTKPEMNKSIYENVTKTLGIPLDTFIKKANTSPAIYLITESKLEKWIGFVSQMFDYSYEDAKKYVAENINLFGCTLRTTANIVECNYKLLNDEFDIDLETYKKLLKEFSCLITESTRALQQKLNIFAKYFDIDKYTHREMIIKNPRITTKFINDIDKILSESSAELNIDKDEFKQMAIKEPLLITRFVAHHKIDIPQNAELLGVSEKEYIELGRKNPKLLSKAFETVEEIKDVLLNN